MAQAAHATSGQARAFNAAIISLLDEEALKQINGPKFQQVIDKPAGLIHNLVRFINNDCRPLIGPLMVNLKEKPKSDFEIVSHLPGENIAFDSGKIELARKLKHNEGHLSAKEYKKRLEADENVIIANANIIEFFENYQYDPKVAAFLKPYQGKELYQFGTIFRGSFTFFSYLYWNGKYWTSVTEHFDDNWILNGYAFVIKTDGLNLLPFHESIVSSIDSCATYDQALLIGRLLLATRIPQNHEAIIAAWERLGERSDLRLISNFQEVKLYLLSQKNGPVKNATTKNLPKVVFARVDYDTKTIRRILKAALKAGFAINGDKTINYFIDSCSHKTLYLTFDSNYACINFNKFELKGNEIILEETDLTAWLEKALK